MSTVDFHHYMKQIQDQETNIHEHSSAVYEALLHSNGFDALIYELSKNIDE